MSKEQKYYEELIIKYDKKVMKLESILTKLEEWLNYQFEHTLQQNNYHSVLNKIQELKEKYSTGDKERK